MASIDSRFRGNDKKDAGMTECEALITNEDKKRHN